MAGIIQGVTRGGVPVKVLVDDDGRLEVGDDSPLEALQLAMTQSLLREIIRLRLGMTAAGGCKEVRVADVSAALKAALKG